MKIKSALATQISGSVGGLTGSHNRGGLYLRSRAIPTDPATSRQIETRSLFGAMSTAWSSTLTDSQRAAWDQYGLNVPVTDRLGDSIHLSGQQWFVAANTLRTKAGISLVLNGPTTYTRPALEMPEIDEANADSELIISFDDTDDWANETGGALVIFGGRPQSAGINFFKGPYRLAGTVNGDDTTPPTSPATLNSEYTLTADQKVWVRAVAILADGRFSPAAVIGPETVITAA